MNGISIIIPTLNEEHTLHRTVDHALKASTNTSKLEFIVVDSGSGDNTQKVADNLPVRFVSKPGFVFKKYASLNYGVSLASYDTLLFLDADTLLPDGFDDLISEKLDRYEVVGGAFEMSFQKPDFLLWLLSKINRFRYKLERIYFGDQSVWVRKEVFDRVGGFPEQPLMESAYLCKILKKEGKLTLIKDPVKTSPRRFQKYGIFKVSFFDLNMIIRFNLGMSVSDYADKYWEKNLVKK